jgi:hypothetical protein
VNLYNFDFTWVYSILDVIGIKTYTIQSLKENFVWFNDSIVFSVLGTYYGETLYLGTAWSENDNTGVHKINTDIEVLDSITFTMKPMTKVIYGGLPSHNSFEIDEFDSSLLANVSTQFTCKLSSVQDLKLSYNHTSTEKDVTKHFVIGVPLTIPQSVYKGIYEQYVLNKSTDADSVENSIENSVENSVNKKFILKSSNPSLNGTLEITSFSCSENYSGVSGSFSGILEVPFL